MHASVGRRGRNARKAARTTDTSTLYAVTLRDYMQRRANASTDDVGGDDDDDDDYLTSQQHLPPMSPREHSTTVASQAAQAPPALAESAPGDVADPTDTVASDIAAARRFVNSNYEAIVPSTRGTLPEPKRPPTTADAQRRNCWKAQTPARARVSTAGRTPRLPAQLSSASPPAHAAPGSPSGSDLAAPASQIRRLQKIAHEGFQEFRSAQRCAQAVLDEIDVSADPHAREGVAAVWSVLGQLVLNLGIEASLWDRIAGVLRPTIFNEDEELHRDVSADRADQLAVKIAMINRKQLLLPRLGNFVSSVRHTEFREKMRMALRAWNEMARQGRDKRNTVDCALQRRMVSSRLSTSFLRWRRVVAVTRRRQAQDQAVTAVNEARAAKASLQAAVTRGKEETMRELKRVQSKYDDERALREAQFQTLSSEIRSLSGDVTSAQEVAAKANAERDLWRSCWEPVRDSFTRRSLQPVPGVLISDGKCIKLILEQLCHTDELRYSYLGADSTEQHRSVSQAGAGELSAYDIAELTTSLQESVQDLLVHWANAQLSEFGAERSLLSMDDLRDGELFSTLCDGIYALIAEHRSVVVDLAPTSARNRFWRLVQRVAHLPQVHALIVHCPSAGRSLADDAAFLNPDDPGWHYWVLATLFVLRCSVWYTEELEQPSDLHIRLRRGIAPGVFLRRPVPEDFLGPGSGGASRFEFGSAPKPKPPRGARRKSSASARPKQSSTAKLGGSAVQGAQSPNVSQLEAQSVRVGVLEESVKQRDADGYAKSIKELREDLVARIGEGTDPAQELLRFEADTERRRMWNAMQLLVGTAVVEFRCLDFDANTNAFRGDAAADAADETGSPSSPGGTALRLPAPVFGSTTDAAEHSGMVPMSPGASGFVTFAQQPTGGDRGRLNSNAPAPPPAAAAGVPHAGRSRTGTFMSSVLMDPKLMKSLSKRK